LGGQAAITTAGDLRLGLALDAPPPGWRLGNSEDAKGIMAALLAGESIALENETAVAADWLTGLPLVRDARLRLRVTERAETTEDALLLHPSILAMGIGCERLAPEAEVIALAEAALESSGLSPFSLACIVTIDLKAAEPAIHAAAAHFGV